MTKTVILYCHPYQESFSHAVLQTVTTHLAQSHADYQILDLYADGFDPVVDSSELALYAQGGTHDALAKTYLTALQSATQLILIFPVWWNDLSAMIKGFFDKVMKRGTDQAYVATRTGLRGNLTQIRSTLILTSSTSPTPYLRLFCGDSINRVLIHSTLKQLGIKHVTWRNMGGITTSTIAKRTAFLGQIPKLINAQVR
ncbi:NAD(P)H-dependent oxidoreductase [Secundilactobacillus paracollinoides]|uniref:NAD(P)H-dependent oxidoreductase n=1 Tax=Secundilactobacillus paracollinoides TaxID=240427 RepID=UPI0006D1021E|nr:NAD(P)H-dependent oxidoreductase [Secundilactobacillus paracollinoides]KRL76564.1 NADPH-quinone reductase (modulator of drug activity B) [Secundilactobacillus paracollinoides DSM 15502 = JCM 11969]